MRIKPNRISLRLHVTTIHSLDPRTSSARSKRARLRRYPIVPRPVVARVYEDCRTPTPPRSRSRSFNDSPQFPRQYCRTTGSEICIASPFGSLCQGVVYEKGECLYRALREQPWFEGRVIPRVLRCGEPGSFQTPPRETNTFAHLAKPCAFVQALAGSEEPPPWLPLLRAQAFHVSPTTSTVVCSVLRVH